MADIDLIPQDYRTRLWLQYSVKRMALVVVFLLGITIAAFVVLNRLAAGVDRDIVRLQQQQAITTRQREALTQLNETRKNLEQRLRLLNGLRSGASAETMFITIDRSLMAGEVWFQDWQFQRAGSAVAEPAEPASNGYFIVMSNSGSPPEAWKIETHMTIRGQARDHSALSRFVRRLYEQPEIQDIRILNTSLASNREFVDFNLAVTVNTSGPVADG